MKDFLIEYVFQILLPFIILAFIIGLVVGIKKSPPIEMERLKKECQDWGGYYMVSPNQRNLEGKYINRVYCWKQENVETLFDYDF